MYKQCLLSLYTFIYDMDIGLDFPSSSSVLERYKQRTVGVTNVL